MRRERFIFFDLVTDHIRSRALTVFSVLFVVQLVFFLVGSNILVDPRSSAARTVTRVELFEIPKGVEKLGAWFSSQTRVVHDGLPVEAVPVEMRVSSIQTDLLRETLVCRNDDNYSSFLDHSASRIAICDAAFRNQRKTVTSNLCGISEFNVSIGAGNYEIPCFSFLKKKKVSLRCTKSSLLHEIVSTSPSSR